MCAVCPSASSPLPLPLCQVADEAHAAAEAHWAAFGEAWAEFDALCREERQAIRVVPQCATRAQCAAAIEVVGLYGRMGEEVGKGRAEGEGKGYAEAEGATPVCTGGGMGGANA